MNTRKACIFAGGKLVRFWLRTVARAPAAPGHRLEGKSVRSRVCSFNNIFQATDAPLTSDIPSGLVALPVDAIIHSTNLMSRIMNTRRACIFAGGKLVRFWLRTVARTARTDPPDLKSFSFSDVVAFKSEHITCVNRKIIWYTDHHIFPIWYIWRDIGGAVRVGGGGTIWVSYKNFFYSKIIYITTRVRWIIVNV